ncbi:non-ribosomal peptide synthetase [Kitasatospora sp. MMS16-BH015]|uniref:non-ribosomal peptide synthetase n=1 Tax=Kitasatospora sp. MMS16-BH015 TaxID=2018025 RepID=UPI000CA2A878|nr:non-ribosomal peptide synthetase [Kitasatospora sp. MMS16-BH015]AUG75711.1 non-ribosomal peptide synthetase [Kitasatospora sp. MMS16-BH015]
MIDSVRQFVELPASPAQQALWVIDRFGGEAASYAVPCALRIEGAFDPVAAEYAFERLVLRHEPLRTCFRWHEGKLTQLVAEPAAGERVPLDWAVLPVPVAEWEERARAEAARAFELERGPLLRVRLLVADGPEQLLVLCAHHIVVDGTSYAVLLREFAALYNARLAGTELELPEPELQYGDYAQWQLDRLTEEVIAADLAHWRERLADAPVLELVTDRPRPARQSHRGEAYRFPLGPELSAELAEFAQEEQVTLFAVLLALYQTLLGRYSRAAEVCVGVTVSGRSTPQLQETVGMFVNLVVFRVSTADDPSLSTLAARTQAEFLDGVEHAALPFSWLVERLSPERDLSRNPLFQTAFGLDRSLTEGVRLTGAELRQVDLYLGIAKFDLALTVHEEGGELSAVLEYDSELFDRAAMVRLAGHYRELAAAAVREPGRPLGHLDAVPAAERLEQVEQWNASGGAELRHGTIAAAFEHWAAATPEAPAVLQVDGPTVGYRELNERANRLAHRLRALGIGPELTVGILVPPTVEQVVAVLGTVKAGGVYVPLVPGDPRERLRRVARGAALEAVVTVSALAGRFDYEGAPVVVVLDEPEELRPGVDEVWPCSDPSPAALPDNLAYVLHTSGTTGVPKGIGVSHRAVLHRVHSESNPGLEPGATSLLVAPLSFDGAVWEYWSTLLSGGTMVLPDPALPFPEVLRGALTRHRIDRLVLMPAQLQLALDTMPELVGRSPQLITGGDVLPPYLAGRAVAGLPAGGVMLQTYGPTECTVFATVEPLTAVDETRATVPIGYPAPDATTYVLDEHYALVPVGVPGELWLGGPGVARGYLGRPGLTADRFVPDPFGAPGGRLYRTGDLVRQLPDGKLDFIGRIDSQVKVRGYRIETAEVESVLRRHPQVRAALVVAREDLPGGRGLVGYVVADPGAAPEQELRELLAAALPGYMHPAALVRLDAIPITGNGKADRRALPAPEFGGQAGVEEAPKTATEVQLLAVWTELLGVEGLGRHDKFFDVGGNSMLLVSLHGRLTELLPEVPLALVELFEYTTCAELATVLDRRRSGASAQAGDAYDL